MRQRRWRRADMAVPTLALVDAAVPLGRRVDVDAPRARRRAVGMARVVVFSVRS